MAISSSFLNRFFLTWIVLWIIVEPSAQAFVHNTLIPREKEFVVSEKVTKYWDAVMFIFIISYNQYGLKGEFFVGPVPAAEVVQDLLDRAIRFVEDTATDALEKLLDWSTGLINIIGSVFQEASKALKSVALKGSQSLVGFMRQVDSVFQRLCATIVAKSGDVINWTQKVLLPLVKEAFKVCPTCWLIIFVLLATYLLHKIVDTNYPYPITKDLKELLAWIKTAEMNPKNANYLRDALNKLTGRCEQFDQDHHGFFGFCWLWTDCANVKQNCGRIFDLQTSFQLGSVACNQSE